VGGGILIYASAIAIGQTGGILAPFLTPNIVTGIYLIGQGLNTYINTINKLFDLNIPSPSDFNENLFPKYPDGESNCEKK